MSDLVREWFHRKLDGGTVPFRGIVTVSHEYSSVTGPRSIYAKVSVSISTSEAFVFESRAHWPEENYDRWVLDGILDALFGCAHKPVLGVRVVYGATPPPPPLGRGAAAWMGQLLRERGLRKKKRRP